VAQLALASCLWSEQRLEEALHVYARLAQGSDEHRHAAGLGVGWVLLELDRTDEALDAFDRAIGAGAVGAEASEGRFRALERLGRFDEADAELRRFVALGEGRSDLRARLVGRSG